MPITSRGLLERTGLRREREREREHSGKDRISQPQPLQQQQQQPYQQYNSNHSTPALNQGSPKQYSSSSGSSPALPHRHAATPQRQPVLPRTSSDRSDNARSASDDAGHARTSEGAARQHPQATQKVRKDRGRQVEANPQCWSACLRRQCRTGTTDSPPNPLSLRRQRRSSPIKIA